MKEPSLEVRIIVSETRCDLKLFLVFPKSSQEHDRDIGMLFSNYAQIKRFYVVCIIGHLLLEKVFHPSKVPLDWFTFSVTEQMLYFLQCEWYVMVII